MLQDYAILNKCLKLMSNRNYTIDCWLIMVHLKSMCAFSNKGEGAQNSGRGTT